MEKRVFIQNYGCSANYSHGEIIEGMLKGEGFKLVKKPEESDVIIINTCIVKSVTENKIKNRIKVLSGAYPDKIMIVTGCGADAEKEIFREVNKNIIFVSSHHTGNIIKAIREKRPFLGIRKEDKLLKPKLRKNKIINIVEISQGCLGECSFCITKNARGKLISYNMDKIIKDIEKSLKEGCKEIWITSQDCGCYGFDRKSDLCNLLDKICSIKGEFRIRLGMSNPQFIKLFPAKLAKALKNENIFKFLHIPVQSGSDKILKLMRRGYTIKDFRNIIKIIRKEIPDITISTDIIVGFPEENVNDFQESMRLLEETRPDIVNISKFGARPETEAKKMKQLDSKIIKERTIEIGKMAERIKRDKNAEYIGKEFLILIDETGKKKKQWVGRSENYKPVIVKSEKNLMGKFIKVKIRKASETHLSGEIIPV